MKQLIKVPPSKTEQTIELNLPDSVPFTVSGTTPIGEQPPVENPPPSTDNGKLIYSNNFGASTVLDKNQLGDGSISKTIFPPGATGSFKSLVPAGASQISGGWRSEQQYSENLSPDNTDLIYEYDEMFESLPSNTGGLSVQWHGNYDGTSGIQSLWWNGGKFAVQQNLTGASRGSNIMQQRQADGSSLMAIKFGHWYHMRWEIRFSTGSDGYLRLFIDGKLYYEVKGKTTDGKGQYLKVGQNLFPNSPSSNSVMYIANLNVWQK